MPDHSERRARRRRLLARFAVAACLPYLTLKLLWVAGADAGVRDLGSLSRGQWIAANAVTFGMDAIAALIAHVLTRPGGRHVRAWLILFPMWVATGMLVSLMIALPVGQGVIAATGAKNPAMSNDMLSPWVFGVVYGGLCAEGLVLLAAFTLYVDERWGVLLRTRVRDLTDPAGTQGTQRVLTGLALGFLVCSGVLRLLWGLGSDAGMNAEWIARRNAIGRTRDLVHGLGALAGAAGLYALVFRRWRRARVGVPLAMAWAGVGVAFAAGDWMDVGRSPATSALLGVSDTADLIAGLLTLCVGCFALTELTSGEGGLTLSPATPDARHLAATGSHPAPGPNR
ncbi:MULTISPECIES: hypothetical protein [Streptomyces]|uniref:hypothetical protein n=1 Tax=Streptomyces TaxID=1883 RepID=UPI00163CC810|nr:MULTISPECIES: hypothetical protein [Streptomyces]MBC2879501.1 hypothetical protein [Streptomyces sp. TYQ1024]UBI35021.1 hypothetical protein K7I03_00170 [Streptomyces mobaraensis]UKW27621.1 hypothetical protein MCU78_00200 [Streptomyces sp. TYQ1024]